MKQSTETIIERFRHATLKLRRQINNPAKARAFLIRAGIAEISPSSRNGVRLVKELR
jgi:hypothetical protein